MFLNKKNIYKISAISLGFTSVITQIIVIREFLSVYSSNELVIGILFSNWMLLTGLGAFAGKYFSTDKEKAVPLNMILIGVLPLATVYSLSFFRNLIFTPGRMLSPFEIYYSSFLLLIPFCLFSGFLFTRLSVRFSKLLKDNKISNVYSLEAIGSILGGALYNFILLFVFSTFESLKVLFTVNIILAILFLFYIKKKRAAFITTAGGLLIAFFIIPANIDIKALSFLYPAQEIIDYQETPFGKITITKVAGQLNFYENGTTLFTIKYNISSVDYVELNPWLIKEGEKFTGNIIKNPKVRIINEDARLFLKKTVKKYDIVIINLPAPSNLEVNRYYTLEFFTEVKRSLNAKGILSVSLPATANYAGTESVMLQSVLYSTLKKVFKNVLIIPGGRNYFLSSDGHLSYKITELTEKRNINTEYVNKYYIDDNQIKERGTRLTNETDPGAEINRDLKPVASFLQWKYWLAHFNISGNLWILILIIPVLIVVARMNIINTALFTTGFTSVATEMIIIISFQIIYGYIYQMTGIIITLFMAGLAYGSFRFYKIVKVEFKSYYRIQFLTGIFTFIIPLAIYLLNTVSTKSIFVHLTFIILILISGVLTGTQFSLATKLSKGGITKKSAISYSSEITGSAFGALLISTVLIPVIGIFSTCVLIGVINLIVASIMFSKSRFY